MSIGFVVLRKGPKVAQNRVVRLRDLEDGTQVSGHSSERGREPTLCLTNLRSFVTGGKVTRFRGQRVLATVATRRARVRDSHNHRKTLSMRSSSSSDSPIAAKKSGRSQYCHNSRFPKPHSLLIS